MTKQRHIAVTLGTGSIAAVTAIWLLGAPPIPAALGITVVVLWLIRRGPIV